MAPAATSTQTSSPRSLRPSTNPSSSTTPPPVPLGRLRALSSSLGTSLGSTPPSSITLNASHSQSRLKSPPDAQGIPSVRSSPTTPSLTSIAISPYSLASRTPRYAESPILPTPGHSRISTKDLDPVRQELRKWLHIRAWWQGFIAVVTLVVGVIGLVYSAYRSYNLARWTAAKDFYQQCQSAKAENISISRECATALSMGLAPPPYVYNDFFTNLRKRCYDTGYRDWQKIRIHVENFPSSPSSSAAAWDDITRVLPTFDTPSESTIWWPMKLLILLVPFIAGGGILFFMYRKLSKSAKVATSAVRSVEPIKITQGPPERQFSGLRQRIRTSPVDPPDLDPDHQDFTTYDWHEEWNPTPDDDTLDYGIEPSDTAFLQPTEHDPDSPDNRDTRIPSAWHIPTEEEQKTLQPSSPFKLFLQDFQKPPDAATEEEESQQKTLKPS